MFVGTPAYMAPERHGDQADQRSDLFSLGCLLYHMLAGSSPFRGKDAMAILTALIEHTPPSLVSMGANPDRSISLLRGSSPRTPMHGRSRPWKSMPFWRMLKRSFWRVSR